MTHLPIIHNLEATNLNMAENNVTMVMAQDFSGLLNLDTLDLSKNSLNDESFGSNSLSSLTLLKKLDLDSNRLSGVPALSPSVEVLKMNDNKIGTLSPHCFTGLVNLLNLELVGNALHESTVSPLAFRPAEKLLSLHVDKNHFTSIPLGLPRSLQTLKMSGNMIDRVTEEALKGCSHLKLLDLSHNQLHDQSVPASTWSHLKSLEALDLSSNQFTSVPTNLPRRLRKLTLRHNDILHVPAFSFRHLRPGLQSLQLSHNHLSDGSAGRASFVGMYRSMSELLLDNNRLEEVPPFIRQFKSLKMLRLDNNHIRAVRRWGICHPRNSGSMLAAVHLENNRLQVDRIPADTFSCLIDAQGLVLYPQQGQSNS
ncbi:extracellular matrix protein 2 [Takifugu rubripes]|uniref:extracellular matrix protein 2 n=1 Tax=Takifugu rubripes TaxID=31033 RepID=UPI0011455AA8|nr:extracellular matrix protein 2-like [Takifugu rubripes]